MTLPFNVFTEKDDPRLIEIVKKTLALFERIGRVSIPANYSGAQGTEGDFNSPGWYVAQAYNSGRKQVNSSRLWKLFEREPWQKQERHFELMVMESDLYYPSPDNNFIFGETKMKIHNKGIILKDHYSDGSPRIAGTIQSVHRIRRWYGSDWELAFCAILTHELGHFFGMPSASSPNYVGQAKHELDVDHCNDRDCIMEQVNIPGRPDLLTKAKHLLRNNPDWFCKPDLAALQDNLQRLYTS